MLLGLSKVTYSLNTWLLHVFNVIFCLSTAAIAQKYKVNKYPTLKLFVYGEPIKREYRGQRSAEAFDKFIRDQLASPIVKKETFEEMDAISVSVELRLINYFFHRVFMAVFRKYISVLLMVASCSDD